jgi:hypothetical protein
MDPCDPSGCPGSPVPLGRSHIYPLCFPGRHLCTTTLRWSGPAEGTTGRSRWAYGLRSESPVRSGRLRPLGERQAEWPPVIGLQRSWSSPPRSRWPPFCCLHTYPLRSLRAATGRRMAVRPSRQDARHRVRVHRRPRSGSASTTRTRMVALRPGSPSW